MSEHAATSEQTPVDICRAKHPDAWWIVCQLDVDHVGDHVRDCAPVEVGERLAFSQHTVRWSDPCECDSHTGVGEDLWKCDECGEVIRYIDDPNGKVTLTTLHPYRNRRVRVEMVTPGTRPGNRGWWSRFVELDASRRVTRHAVDQVNNNLTAQLLWCATHVEPVWVYGDGSFECPHDAVVGWNSDGNHELVAPPWENPYVPAGTRWPR